CRPEQEQPDPGHHTAPLGWWFAVQWFERNIRQSPLWVLWRDRNLAWQLVHPLASHPSSTVDTAKIPHTHHRTWKRSDVRTASRTEWQIGSVSGRSMCQTT